METAFEATLGTWKDDFGHGLRVRLTDGFRADGCASAAGSIEGGEFNWQSADIRAK
jgi:hypothetical protein